MTVEEGQQRLDTTGARIKEYRLRAGLSLGQLSQAAGVSKSYLSNLEARVEDKRPSAQVLFKIAKALGVTMADLLGHKVVPSEATPLEPSLLAFVEAADLPDGDVRMLASIRFRGDPPRTIDRWRYIYQALRTSQALDG